MKKNSSLYVNKKPPHKAGAEKRTIKSSIVENRS